MKKIVAWAKKQLRELLELKDAPHTIAVGASIGIFFGFTPLWGLKTLLTLGVTKLLRGSLVAAVIGVTLHDLILPIMPFLLRWQYQLGYWILSHPHQWPPSLRLHLHRHTESAEHWWQWSTFFHNGLPLLLGSVVISLPISIASYYVTIALVKRRRLRALAKELKESETAKPSA
jgi:uncharacterized protein (DUF2062 family)